MKKKKIKHKLIISHIFYSIIKDRMD